MEHRVVQAQGVTSGIIRGSVVAADSSSVDGARVRVLNTTTGYQFPERVVWNGHFRVEGLDIGGPYTLTITRIGFQTERRERLFLKLGEPLELPTLVLQTKPMSIDTMRVVSDAGFPRINAHGGTATTLSDSLIHRLPTLDRNFHDFLRTVPQISTKAGFGRAGMIAVGANYRFNNFLVNGVEERQVHSNGPATFNNGKSIPLEAVKEYQVVIAPFDVRYGDFAGGEVNTVGNSGTNQLRGATFTYWRNDRLARTGDTIRSPYDRLQYGFALGGPIVHDRVHFFVAPEFQRQVAPAAGPYVGQPENAKFPVPVSTADIARLDTLMRRHNLVSGSGGRVELSTPLRNLYSRVDALLPRWRSRASAFVTYASVGNDQFSRTTTDEFPLSSFKRSGSSSLRVAAVQLHTDLPGARGAHNQLSISHSRDRISPAPEVRQPVVRVRVPGTTGNVTLITGSEETAQGIYGRAWSFKIRDDVSFPLGVGHVLRSGVQLERFRNSRGGVTGSYGKWTFESLDAFERGTAELYELTKDMDSANPSLRGGQYAAWVGDEWRAGSGVTVTMGVRADMLGFNEHAPYVAAVDSIFGRRTDEMPHARVHISPRIGFTWNPSGAGSDQLRGGVGVFTGRPPLAWMMPALSSYGVGLDLVRCGSPYNAELPPAFEPDYRKAPQACATGAVNSSAPKGPVDLLDPNLRMAQTLRAALAYDRRLPGDFLFTGEALFSRHVSDFRFVNLNLKGPQATDQFGRVMYGTIRTNGLADPQLKTDRFTEVIDLTNTSKNYSYELSARVERRFTRGTAAIASYTFSRTRDVASLSRVTGTGSSLAIWGDARALSGRHDDLVNEISLNDLPHRVVAALTYTAPWQRGNTTFSFYYVGESGSPFTYLAYGDSKRGDLNADGSNINDPIYVPRNVHDANEIRFVDAPAATAGEQQAAFEHFIDTTPCLRRQRGHILERNSCREPWAHTSIANVRQIIPFGGRAVEAGLDLFNVLNLLNRNWGQFRLARPALLEHVGQTAGAPDQTQPIFRFNAQRPEWDTPLEQSVFQLQLSLRYRF